MFKVARLRPDGMITAKADTGGLGQLQNVSRRSECPKNPESREVRLVELRLGSAVFLPFALTIVTEV